MSPSTGLELDFGFGNLLDGSHNANVGVSTGSTNALTSSLSEFGASNGTAATDFLSLSNLFDSSNNNGASAGAAPSTSWQTKKTLLDQQLQQDQNSLNALLSQHSSGSGAVVASTTTGVSNANTNPQNAFGFATREELESLAACASSNVQPSFPAAAVQQQVTSTTVTSSSNTGGNNNGSNNNYMFVATIVDPTQEDAPPQQMLFLPGSNQVIPMPSTAATSAAAVAAGAPASGGISPMMALANLPVVFPQGNSGYSSALTGLPTTAELTGNTATHWSSFQTQQLQQQHGLLGLNAFSTGLNNLEDTFSSHTATAPFDFSSLGLATAEQVQTQQLQQLPAFAATKAENAHVPSAANAVNANANTPTSNKAAMPVRPLSAYNFFFSDERERILQNKTDESDVFDNAKKQRLLLAHLAKDRSKRRPHRKTHGKINFTTLSKLIGQRWKQLPDERKNFYREVAAIDLERYQRDLRERSPPNGSPAGADFCT